MAASSPPAGTKPWSRRTVSTLASPPSNLLHEPRHLTCRLRLAAFAWSLFTCVAVAQAPADPDPFGYLENDADARTQAFYREQDAAARAKLDAIPGRGELLARIRALREAATTVASLALGGHRVFYLRRDARHAQAVLCMRESLTSPERELVDPSRFDRGGVAAAIAWIAPSPDGRHVAYGVNRGEAVVLRVHSVEARADLPLEIDRARFNEHLAWSADGRGFFYSRVPESNPRGRRDANPRIYHHLLGRESARDEIVFAAGVGGARDVPEEARVSLHLPADSRYAYALVRDGVSREAAVHVAEQRALADGRPHWRKLASASDGVLAIQGWQDELYLLVQGGAPRHRVLRVKATAASLAGARVVVPEGEVVVEQIALARDALYLRTALGGVDRLERVPIGLLGNTRTAEFIRIPFDNAISEMVTHPRTPGAILRLQGWIEAPAVVQVEARSGNIRDTRLQPPVPVDFSAIDEVRLYAATPDGSRVPVTLLYRKTTRLSGDHPTLLLAEGAYGASVRPQYDSARLAWLERGGVIAVAHVRGGGEYGEAWHRAGRGTNKANSVGDFVTVAEFLVRYGFTQPRRLAAAGEGAGAIPAAVAALGRPGLFAALVARAPLADLTALDRVADGASQYPEFGAPDTPEARERLRGLSAQYYVREQADAPAALVIAVRGDVPFDAWQGAKLAARMQATNPRAVVMLRSDDASRRANAVELADIYAFLFAQLGEPGFAAPPPPPPAAEEPPAADPTPAPRS
jgi:prolyl oligopeptidase